MQPWDALRHYAQFYGDNPRLTVSIAALFSWLVSCASPAGAGASSSPGVWAASLAGQWCLPLLLSGYVVLMTLPYHPGRLGGPRPREHFRDEDYRLRLLKEWVFVYSLFIFGVLLPSATKADTASPSAGTVTWRQAAPCLLPLASFAFLHLVCFVNARLLGRTSTRLQTLALFVHVFLETLCPARENALAFRRPADVVIFLLPVALAALHLLMELMCRSLDWCVEALLLYLCHTLDDHSLCKQGKLADPESDALLGRPMTLVAASCLVAAGAHGLRLARVLVVARSPAGLVFDPRAWARLGTLGIFAPCMVAIDCGLFGSWWFFLGMLFWAALVMCVCFTLRAPVLLVLADCLSRVLLHVRWQVVLQPSGSFVFSDRPQAAPGGATEPLLATEAAVSAAA